MILIFISSAALLEKVIIKRFSILVPAKSKEYTFSDLHTNNVPLRFDFAIFNKQHQLIQLIEYDGKQHYIPVEKFGGEKAFNHLKLNDERKNKYCKEHNIKLVRIPYTNLDIKLKDLEID